MNKNQRYLLKLLSSAIRDQIPPEPGFKSVNWNYIYSEAVAHEVHTLIYPTLCKLNPIQTPSQDLMDKWRDCTLLAATKQLQCMDEARRVLAAFNKYRIPVIALKGITLRNLYPQPELRTMGDIDLLVQPQLKVEAGKILESMGYNLEANISNVSSYYHTNFLNIELHHALFFAPSFVIMFAEFEAKLWSNTNTDYVFEQISQVLSTEDSITYIMAHMSKHFLGSGFGLRQLCDITLLVEKYISSGKNIKFIKENMNQKLSVINLTILKICKDYLNLYVPLIFEIDNDNVEIMLNYIFKCGVYGKKSITDSISSVVSGSLYGKPRNQKGIIHASRYLLSNILFPPTCKMNERFKYAKKSYVLLPIAWIHRFFHALINKTKNRPLYEITKIIKIPYTAKKRIKLLKSLDLI